MLISFFLDDGSAAETAAMFSGVWMWSSGLEVVSGNTGPRLANRRRRFMAVWIRRNVGR